MDGQNDRQPKSSNAPLYIRINKVAQVLSINWSWFPSLFKNCHFRHCPGEKNRMVMEKNRHSISKVNTESCP